jgi:putative DNA primase/helicase
VSSPFDSRDITATTTSEEGRETGVVPAADGDTANTGQLTAPATEASQAPVFIRPIFDRMPPELKILKNWVIWAPVWSGSKWTKRPIQTNGYGASTNNPKHWSSFDEVKQEYERSVARGYMELREKGKAVQQVPVGGVGFVFDGQPDADGLVFAGVDFDKVISGSTIASLAEERIRRIGSYLERSVSGTGLHVIVKARPLASGISQDGVEMYTSGRYFTMTGRAPSNARIVAAPEPFAALASELQANLKQSQAGADATIAGSAADEAAQANPVAWLDQLPSQQRSEVIKYAALHIARNSKLFERTKHGGNYQDYLKLGFAIARSGVEDAEAIFVEAASMAKDAAPEEELREFFQKCASATAPKVGITVGTLLHLARQCGGTFSKWKQEAPDSAAGELRFVPGNEAACREALDEMVAADDRTFVLDRGGPLAILRVPDRDALEPGVRWEGDLPGTTLATSADIMERAERLRWIRKNQNGFFSRARPPRDFVNDYLPQMRGRYRARVLRGIARMPRIDDNGDIHFITGFDPVTSLYHDRTPTFAVPDHPSSDEVRKALELLSLPFCKYKFEDQAKGLAQLLGLILTAVERPWLPTAPLICVRSSMPGTGKGLLVRSIVRLAYDTEPVFATWGATGEEFEKRLAALLLASAGAICIDNVNGKLIQGELLESIITEGRADIRPLGVSQMVRVRNRSLMMLTGNNPIITGDMARRTLACDIVPRSVDPERDRYSFNPADIIQRKRSALVGAAFTIMRAFRQAGMPSHRLPAVGSFPDWSRKVRDAVYWLTQYDLAEAFHQNKREDPRRQDDAALAGALHDLYGSKPFKSSDVLAVHSMVAAGKRGGSVAGTQAEVALHDALERVLGSKRVDAKLFGFWARRLNGAHNGGFLLETRHDKSTNANEITVRRT